MTIEERMNRLEHVTAGIDERARKEHEEDRQLWRDTQRQIQALADQLAEHKNEAAERDRITDERFRETAERFRQTEERFRETDERFRQTDERVQALVSAIGEWIRKSNA